MVNATLVTLKLLDESDQENLPDPLCYYSSLRGYRLTQDSGLKLSLFIKAKTGCLLNLDRTEFNYFPINTLYRYLIVAHI